MSYGCLSGSCSDNLFSQLALPHTYTQVHRNTHADNMHQHEAGHNYEKASMPTPMLDASFAVSAAAVVKSLAKLC